MWLQKIRNIFFSMSWDTRCRNTDVAQIVNPFLEIHGKLLDVGCGTFGLASFLRKRNVIGIDVITPLGRSDGSSFVTGSMLSLPFADQSFSVVASVDALEHLPKTFRAFALGELLRVARRAVVVSFPDGNRARLVDENFRSRLKESNKDVPEWVNEHLENEYPDVETIMATIEAQARESGRAIQTAVYYSERLEVAKFLRWSAVKGRSFYLIGSFLSGFMFRFLRGVNKENSYRSILLVQFSSHG